MTNRFTATYRYLFGFLGLTAIITEIVALIHRGTFNPANFFSFFTILSNLTAVVIFAIFGYLNLSHETVSHRLVVIKGAVTIYMLMTGVIFAALLAPIENAVLTAVPWDNIVLHYIIPIAVCADWLLLQTRTRITFPESLTWLSFPAAYVVYSLVRGHFVGWYPYPFLDAAQNGYTKVIIVILILFTAVFIASQLARKSVGLFARQV